MQNNTIFQMLCLLLTTIFHFNFMIYPALIAAMETDAIYILTYSTEEVESMRASNIPILMLMFFTHI